MTADLSRTRLTKLKGFPLNPHANKCPAGYSLDLYCDRLNPAHAFFEFPHGLIGETYRDVARQARALGWKLHPDGFATCPKCTGHAALPSTQERPDD
jgi:hypothetical protein